MRTTILLLMAAAAPLAAQNHRHTPGMTHPGIEAKEGGQAAFAALAEVVRILESDPETDWSKVNLEGLRQHLLDMDDVTLRSLITTRTVPGGIDAEVTGTGRAVASIQGMLRNHAEFMNVQSAFRATVTPTATGARIAIRAAKPSDAAAVTKLRGLGVIGWLALDAHHTTHHLALARGTMTH
ncbi:MAG: hypothetical protein ACYC2K_09025 [Gemmatimonadales bacterium]